MSLATILGLDDRTKISFFKKGLHAKLKKALSFQITLPTGFEEFVQACIKIDNQIRGNREACDAIPRTQGGQFHPTFSTSTGTHSGPMDLSGARYHSQKRGPVTDQERSAAGTTTCAYIEVPPAIGLWNAPIRDLEESPLDRKSVV